MNKPRKPTQAEKSDLVYYVVNEISGIGATDQMKFAHAWVEDAAIAVFDDCLTDYPGYVLKLMMVVWHSSPEQYEVFIWREDGAIVRINQHPEYHEAGEWW
jgi:hypothetical protein